MYNYFIYSKPAGEKRFTLTDLQRGTVGLKKVYAPRYSSAHLDGLKKALDYMAAHNPGAQFQIRKLDGKTIIYQA